MDTERTEPPAAEHQPGIAIRIADAWDKFVDRFVLFSSAAYPALIVSAVLFAFFTQPAMKFVAIHPTFDGALILGLGVILVRVSYKMGRDMIGILGGILAVGIGAYYLDTAVEAAMRAAAANDRRCWYVEQEMLSPQPQRSDLPDLFTALGCRPQSDGLVKLAGDSVSSRDHQHRPSGGR